ncbi:MAG: formylglycine-generating enzyme family protein [Pirellulaceae bacterium]|nr:formylglycine-generating enzyme family protein [Pirellulaceae bacterium]
MTLISRFRRKSDKPSAEAEEERNDSLVAQAIPSVEQLHYCRVLQLPVEGESVPDPTAVNLAWNSLEEQMTPVPEGEVSMLMIDPGYLEGEPTENPTELAWVQTFYLDRCAVTNAEFSQFVAEGGYAQEYLWPAEILSHVLQFVDSTGCAGPRFWVNGQPPAGKENHPVVGICWYEANAYAHWRGKRLPTPAEWQRAATWAGCQGDAASQSRYPWGDSFDPSRCNTWNSGLGDTSAANEYYNGCTPNGVYQLIGNTWEWTAALFEVDVSPNGDRLLTSVAMGEIRGGAFDTYFASQATSQFRTGQNLLHRGRNTGFRCTVDADELVPPSDPYSFLEEGGES